MTVKVVLDGSMWGSNEEVLFLFDYIISINNLYSLIFLVCNLIVKFQTFYKKIIFGEK